MFLVAVLSGFGLLIVITLILKAVCKYAGYSDENAALPYSGDYPDTIDVATILTFYDDTDDPNVTSRPDIGSISILVSVGGVTGIVPMKQNNDAVVACLIQLLS